MLDFQTDNTHDDDIAVDKFARMMKAKLAAARAKGRSGWDDPEVCTVESLADMLVEHLFKGNANNFVDIANFAMMLHLRGADPGVLVTATNQRVTDALDSAVTLLQSWENVGTHCTIESGVCGCGDSVEGHGMGSGHTPVDMGANYAAAVLTATTNFLKEHNHG